MLRFLIFLLFECSEYLVWHRCADNISTNGSPDYFHRFSSNEIRAYEIEQEYLSAVQDPEPLSILIFWTPPLEELQGKQNISGEMEEKNKKSP